MNITWFDFSGVYGKLMKDVSPAAEGPSFLYRIGEEKNAGGNNNRYLLKCSDIRGTNAYCDPKAEKELCSRMRTVPKIPFGIHFLDNGNYHYVSALMTAQIKIPYVLVLMDHHPDLRRPAFGDILSCGSWILRVLETQPLLQRVVMIGTDPELLAEELSALQTEGKDEQERSLPLHVEGKDLTDKIVTLCKDSGDMMEDVLLRHLPQGAPVYLSIDKDVLSVQDVHTNWDQGGMRLPELLFLTDAICGNRRILGVDICGEPSVTDADAEVTQSCVFGAGRGETVREQSAGVNEALLQTILSAQEQAENVGRSSA